MIRFHFFRVLAVLILTCTSLVSKANGIPSDKVLEITELQRFLKPDVRAKLTENGGISIPKLALYFRTKFSERFFYDHKTFYERFDIYNKMYNNQAYHQERAMDHIGKFADSTQWVLPFNYLNGKPVNAYALRHLARQHKMVDVALHYFNDGKNPKYIRYFETQMQSLNAALRVGKYEKIEDGNGTYEVFRSGYRILNWLWIHNMFLNEAAYTDEDQLRTIATLLQHAANLYENNDAFQAGNHQTRGMSALAMLSILFRDFEGADQWHERAMTRLGEHLDKEINADGFQFERSVHYHISDINTYFYVYQLAKISHIKVNENLEKKLRMLFSTLTKIAYPDKTAPVLQDDTDNTWAEKNEISQAVTLGYLLFEDPEFGYFADDKVDNETYWFLQNAQLELLKHIERKKPSFGSVAFPNTHYYIMREGWNPNDKMMIISAGLEKDKPDHQHGDMLGVQAIANGQVVLPNYQVAYALPDFQLFKNSLVKNVALVDDELQGRQWTGNAGGSGFGQYKFLPKPKVITWKTHEPFDLFVGSHDGFEHKGVGYSRQVIFLKNDFWIVKDNFKSDSIHEYKQVWQGHYTKEAGPNLMRAIFADARGCDILQLNNIDRATQAGEHGKNRTILSKIGENKFSFLTVIYPYKGYGNRMNETDLSNIGAWKLNKSAWTVVGNKAVALSKDDENYFFDIKELKLGQLKIQLSETADVYVQLKEGKLTLILIGDATRSISVFQGNNELTNSRNKNLMPGDSLILGVK